MSLRTLRHSVCAARCWMETSLDADSQQPTAVDGLLFAVAIVRQRLCDTTSETNLFL